MGRAAKYLTLKARKEAQANQGRLRIRKRERRSLRAHPPLLGPIARVGGGEELLRGPVEREIQAISTAKEANFSLGGHKITTERGACLPSFCANVRTGNRKR
jgi:hypothetical protein